MKNKWIQRLTFFAGMLGVAGPGLVQAFEQYRAAKLIIQVVSGLALAFVVQSRTQREEQKADEQKPTP